MKITRLLILAVMIMLINSCNTIHEYPDDNPVNPMLIDVELKFNLINKDFDPFVPSRSTTIPTIPDHDIRYITEVYAIGSTSNEFITRKVSTVSNEDVEKIAVNLKLQARNYVFLFWIDYVQKGSSDDLHYDTQESLQAVRIKRPYKGSTSMKDGFVGKKEFDLRPYKGQWSCIIQQDVELIRPFARFEIITTDVEEFIRSRYENASTPLHVSRVEFSYLPRVATQYNVLKLKPEYYSDSEEFTSNVEYLTSNECRLAYDYIFMNGDQSNVQVKFDIYDQNNKLLNRVNSILIPLRRNALTIYKGEFLTRDFDGSGDIGIDDSFEGDEIIYTIP